MALMTLNELNVDRQARPPTRSEHGAGMNRGEFFVSLLETALNSAERRETHFWMRTLSRPRTRTPETFS